MKQIIKNYTFNKTSKTVTFTDFTTIALERVLLITNTTSNVIIYQFNIPALGGTATTNILTLTYNTGSMNNTDKLQIFYDTADGDPSYETQPVGGNIGSGVADSGNPVKTGGVYRVTPPSISDGQRGDTQIDGLGRNLTNIAPLSSSIDSIATFGQTLELNTLSAGSLNADLFPSMDVTNYRSFSLQVQGTWTGTLTIQVSNDNGTWVSLGTSVKDSSQTILTSGNFTSNGIISGVLMHRYMRIRMTAYTSGTATGIIELSSLFTNAPIQSVTSSGTIGAGVQSNAFYVAGRDASGNLAGFRVADTDAVSTIAAAGVYVYNGTNEDRVRDATAASGSSTGQGILASGGLGHDGANYRRIAVDTSGNTKVNINAGSAIVGKFTTDQTTHGTTDLVADDLVKIAGTAVDVNSGNKSAGTLRVILATDQPQLTNALKIDGSAVTQPISAASLPLPASAATSTKQSDGSQKTQVVDGSGNVVGSTSNALDVNIKSGSSSSTQYAEGATAATATGTLALGKNGTTLKATQTDTSGNLRIDLSQTSANATAIKVDGSSATQPVSGTITANAGTNLNTSALALETGGNLATLATNLPAKGQSTMSASTPVAIASNQSSIPIQGATTEQAALSAGALNADLVASTDVSNYKSVSVHVLTQATGGVLTFQGSNDNSNWVSVNLRKQDGTLSTLTSGAGAIWAGPINYRYFRIRQTSWTSGTSTGICELYGHPYVEPAFSSNQTSAAVPSGITYVAGQARTSSPTAATNGNAVGFMTDTLGKQIVLPYANPENFVQASSAAITDTTSTAILAAAGASVRNYVTSFTVINTSATTGTRVDVLDGATVIDRVYVGTTSTGMNNATVMLPIPLKGTANTAINAQCTTTGANVFVSANGYTAP